MKPRRLISRLAAAAALLLLLGPAPAQAHLVTTGLGPVYDGIGHFLLSPDDVLPALALALFAGLRGPRPGRLALFLLPAAWFVGGLAGLFAGTSTSFPLTPFSFLVLGGLVAADAGLPAGIVAAIAIALGLLHGFLNGAAIKEAGASVPLELTGIMVVLFVLVALFSALVVSLRPPWARIVVRVAGSWIAATGLLLLGWALHQKA
ncbi:MAG TPA: HupE/UreJ family protein [Opitutaceae bacterium]|nr:HupE/UreJ family protein [Opitutaceae bacterium]